MARSSSLRLLRLDRFQKLALSTTLATYLLIAVGGLVRASGAGLGCPDWPRCFDRWIPPLSAADVPAHIDPALFNFVKAWTEYLNRLLGVGVGILIFATMVLAIQHHRKAPRVLWPTTLAFVLVGFEGWLGGMVVRSQLRPVVLTVHLVFALLIVSLLLYAVVAAFLPASERKPLSLPRDRLTRLTLAVMGLLLIQIGLGADVRGQIQLLAEVGREVDRAGWLDQVGLADTLHRNLAVLTTLAVLALAGLVLSQVSSDARLRKLAHVMIGLVLGQVAVGLGLAYLGLPRALQVAHLWLGALLLGALTVLALLARPAIDATPAGSHAPLGTGP